MTVTRSSPGAPEVVATPARTSPSNVASSIDAGTGMVSTVRDLAKFDIALDAGVPMSTSTLDQMWSQVVVGGVVDPALQLSEPRAVPRPDLAAAPQEGPALRILLAHNPALTRLGAQAGFDVQLSGHTHAGQFFPWTLAVRMVHAPHVAGLSRLGKMWVYVNAGTGSWGPPVRFGTRTELTLIRLARG